MAAAPEVVALPPLGVFLLTAVCIALIYAYKVTLGAVITTLANALDVKIPVVGRPFHFLAVGAAALNSQVENLLGTVVNANQRAWHLFVHWQAWIWQETTGAIADLAERSESASRYVIGHVIPQAVSIALGPLGALVAAQKGRLESLARAIAHLPHVIVHEVTRQLVPVKTIIEKRTTIIYRSVPYVIPGLSNPALPRVGQLERDIAHVGDRLDSLGRRLAPAAITGVLVAALARLGLSWPRCSNSQKYGKAICGMDQQLLNSLIQDTALILGTVSLVEFAEGMQGLMGELTPAVRTFWRAT